MNPFDLIVRNAKVATASDIFSTDIGVAGGKITQLGGTLGKAVREIDAGGRWVLPGGIDTHCHFDQPSYYPGIVMADDLYSGSLSAAHGGTTTIVPFAAQMPGQSMRAAVDDYHRRAEGKPVIDYAFHLIIADPTAQVLGQELPALIREGYTSFKVYMTYEGLKLNDRQILEVLALARREGAMTMVHAENSDCVDYLTELLLAAGKTQPIYHAHSRPRLVEREGSHRAITLSELIDVPILLVHVSGEETVEQIRWAQARGLKVYGETCPQYLLLSEHDLDHPHFEGAKYVCSPPPRDKKNQEAIWRALANGTFHVFSSDHSAYRFAGGDGKDHHGKGADFTKIPNGLPGVETRLPLLFSEGVMKGRIDINQFVALTSTNPAKIYGLYPRKGTIAVGSDADFAIWDHERRFRLTNADLHHNCDYTPYEGQEMTGWPSHVISRGEVIVEEGKSRAAKGRGHFLPCALPAPARPNPSI